MEHMRFSTSCIFGEEEFTMHTFQIVGCECFRFFLNNKGIQLLIPAASNRNISCALPLYHSHCSSFTRRDSEIRLGCTCLVESMAPMPESMRARSISIGQSFLPSNIPPFPNHALISFFQRFDRLRLPIPFPA